MNWVICPYVDNHDLTRQAALDVQGQTLPDVRLLLIANGGQPLGAFAGHELSWHFDPPLPSLAAVWNRALRFVWESGGEHALVINNDTRIEPRQYERLLDVQQATGAWFVTGVGTTPDQWALACSHADAVWSQIAAVNPPTHGLRGGPDFSCFCITRVGHTRYPFDEGFQPAYCEDIDMHRRYLLDGHGDKIFGVNLPFLHYRSSTLDREGGIHKAETERRIEAGSRAYYLKKWGGPPNAERYSRPFDPSSDQDGVTTPERQFGGL